MICWKMNRRYLVFKAPEWYEYSSSVDLLYLYLFLYPSVCQYFSVSVCLLNVDISVGLSVGLTISNLFNLLVFVSVCVSVWNRQSFICSFVRFLFVHDGI